MLDARLEELNTAHLQNEIDFDEYRRLRTEYIDALPDTQQIPIPLSNEPVKVTEFEGVNNDDSENNNYSMNSYDSQNNSNNIPASNRALLLKNQMIFIITIGVILLLVIGYIIHA